MKRTVHIQCPRCGSTEINQYRMPSGPMWCMKCGFRVEDKNAKPNPFVEIAKASAQNASTTKVGQNKSAR